MKSSGVSQSELVNFNYYLFILPINTLMHKLKKLFKINIKPN